MNQDKKYQSRTEEMKQHPSADCWEEIIKILHLDVILNPDYQHIFNSNAVAFIGEDDEK